MPGAIPGTVDDDSGDDDDAPDDEDDAVDEVEADPAAPKAVLVEEEGMRRPATGTGDDVADCDTPYRS